LAATVVAAAVGAGAAAENARAALFFLMAPTAANPGDAVTVRTGGTPKSFTLRQRVKPFQQPIRLYLVANKLAPDVHSRFDRRAHFIGRLVPDANGRGLLRFTVPPVDSASYTIGAWCPGCAAYSRGRTWSVVHVTRQNVVARYRPLMLLRITTPAQPCPATTLNGSGGRYGNGALWTTLLPGGTLEVPPSRVEPDGSIGWKFGWTPTGIAVRPGLTVSGRRLDAASPPLRVLGVKWGYSYTPAGRGRGGWASAVSFPSEGCWRITGRVRDISLSFVVRVVVR
jgi:hypothetical protein